MNGGVPQEFLAAPDIAIPTVSGCQPPESLYQTLFGVHAVLQLPASEQHSLEELLPVAPLASYFPMDGKKAKLIKLPKKNES